MNWEVCPLPFKPSRLTGLSERLVASHYENNYGGALRRLNALAVRLGKLDLAAVPAFEANGLKREELFAYNSVVLHEVYFDALGGRGGDPAGELASAIERDFGSVGGWRREFTGMGRALAGGSGWVVLTWSARGGRLINQWTPDHAHSLADGQPLLALDMYEHAYHLDFGAEAGRYVDAVMANLDWQRVARRYDALGRGMTAQVAEPDAVSVEELMAMMNGERPPLVLDVRLNEDFDKASDLIAMARHLDPLRVEEWASDLPAGQPVVAYCLYGFQVCRDAAAALRAQGIDACFLSGGIAAWHAMGGPVTPRD